MLVRIISTLIKTREMHLLEFNTNPKIYVVSNTLSVELQKI